MVFQFEIGQSYALYVGNKKASTPRYDIARFFEYIETSTLGTASMKPLMKNPSFVVAAPKVVPYTERNAYVLNSVLVLLVAVITSLMIAYLKKLKLAKPTP